MAESYPKGLDLGGMASAFIVNSLMRTVGVILRGVLLVIGGSVVVLVFCLGVVSFAIWIILPVITLFIFISGARLLFI